MRKILKETIRFLVRLLFAFIVIMAPFVLCAIIMNSKILEIVFIILAIILIIKGP